MNLIEKLDDELSGIHLDDFEKARYIYLRCCEIFSFDYRWFFTDLFNDDKLHRKIINKEFDLENIDDELVICHSFSKYILKPLIENLTNLDCRLIKNVTHSFVEVNYYGQDWKLDATMGDLARVKLDLPTKGFTSGIDDYDLEVDEIDLNLGFCSRTIDDYSRESLGNSFTDSIENIGRILKNSKAKYHFSDALFLYDMLVNAYSEDNNTYADRNYNFHRLIDVYHEDSFFDLSKYDDEYCLKRIRYDEYKQLTKSLIYK